MDTSAEADISAWLPADPRHPIYTPFVEEETWDDNVDRTLVVAALAVLAEHRLDDDPTVLEALEAIPCGSYRTGWRTFVDLSCEERGLRLDIGSVEEYDSDDGVHEVHWRVGAKAHRQGGPAEASRRGGVLVKSRWCLRGTEHRVGGPSRYDGAETLHEEGWRRRGVLGRCDGPCLLDWFADDGAVLTAVYAPSAGGAADGPTARRSWDPWSPCASVTYHENHVVHRPDGPARIMHRRDGFDWCEEWALNGLVSRADGPAGRYYRGGVLVAEGYWIRGWLWREDGPAFWFQDADGGRHEVWTTRRHAGDRVRFEYRSEDADGHTTIHTSEPAFRSLPGWADYVRAPQAGSIAIV